MVCHHSSEKVIPSANFDLHAVHCKRNLERCSRCGEMVARARSAEHFEETHALVSPSKSTHSSRSEVYQRPQFAKSF